MTAAKALLKAVILGAPASGKGTIASRIVRHFDVTHISSGDILRHEMSTNSEIGQEASKFILNGRLVPDKIMLQLIANRLNRLEEKNWLLDGFPRTREQAETLNTIHPINIALYLDVPEEVIVDRVKGRWVHEASGRVYNMDFNRPKIPGKDDVTGETLVQRPDDKPEVVRERLKIFKTTMKPLIDLYNKRGILKKVSGNTSDEIWPHVFRHLCQLTPCKLPLQ